MAVCYNTYGIVPYGVVRAVVRAILVRILLMIFHYIGGIYVYIRYVGP